MKQPKLSDLYTCNLLKLYHKLYRNRLPPYFDNFLPEFGEHNHMLRNDLIRLPVVRCEYGEMNAKYQMHLTLRNLANPRNQQLPNIEITADTLGTSIHCLWRIQIIEMKQSDSQLFTYKDNRTSYNIKNATFTYKIRDLRTSRQVCLTHTYFLK